MSNTFFLFFHVTLTGVAIAAATYHFSSVINAPTPKIYPVVGQSGIAAALALWILSGPIAVARLGISLYKQQEPMTGYSFLAIFASLVWAFCLGVLVLEAVFQLFLK